MTLRTSKSNIQVPGWQILHIPAIVLGVFFLIPVAMLVVISFYHRTAAFYEPGFEFTHYVRVLEPFYLKVLLRSVVYSIVATTISLAIAFPFTYYLSRLSRKSQVVTLIFVLCILSLSEVIVAFSWSTLLSRSAGISNLFVFLGFMDRPESWSRGTVSVLIGLSYFNLSIAILLMYPHCTKLSRDIVEAANTLGASPTRAFFGVIIPILGPAMIMAWTILFVFTMGALVTPQWLGKPVDWMLASHIANQVMDRGNVPFGAALAMLFLAVTVAFVFIPVHFAKKIKIAT